MQCESATIDTFPKNNSRSSQYAYPDSTRLYNWWGGFSRPWNWSTSHVGPCQNPIFCWFYHTFPRFIQVLPWFNLWFTIVFQGSPRFPPSQSKTAPGPWLSGRAPFWSTECAPATHQNVGWDDPSANWYPLVIWWVIWWWYPLVISFYIGNLMVILIPSI